MKKDTFYRCIVTEDRQITAVKTVGYTEGDIGLHKEDGYWVATHVPTGSRVSSELNKTRRDALAEINQWIAEGDFTDKMQYRMFTCIYAAFLEAKHAQIVTEVV